MADTARELIGASLRLLRAVPPIELRVAGERDGATTIKTRRFATHDEAEGWAVDLDTNPAVRSVYVTMNSFDPVRIKGAAADDQSVTRREWLLVDVDPVRPKDFNSTDGELEAASTTADRIENWLGEAGWPEPVRALSGNGAHILYRIDLPNDERSLRLVAGALATLSERFSTDAVSVDTTVSNASRITKLYGTVTRKGIASAERPQRRSKISRIPRVVEVVPEPLIAALLPVAATPALRPVVVPAHGGAKYDLGQVLSRLAVLRTFAKDGAIWHVVRCPWSSEHSTEREDQATVVVVQPDGAMGFRCLHEHCTGRNWSDLRDQLGIETMGWQEKRARDTARRTEHGIPAAAPAIAAAAAPATDPGIERRSKRVTICDLERRDEVLNGLDFYAAHGRMPRSMSTGMKRLDGMLLGGFREEMFYVLGGESGRGKSSLLMQWAFQIAADWEEERRVVAIVTPEMSADSLDVRSYALLNRQSIADYRRGVLTMRPTWERTRAPQNVRASFDPSDIEAFAFEENPVLFIVDYAQQAVDYSDQKRYTALAELGARCLRIAKSRKIPVILGTQVNVSADREFSIRETKILEHQADVVIYIDIELDKAVDANGHPQVKASSLRVHKHRHGPAGKIPIVWHRELYRFEEEADRNWRG